MRPRRPVALSGKEMFSTLELHLVHVLAFGIVPHHPVHDLHGKVGLAQFLVGPGHLIERLVIVLVMGIYR